jgi:hypothetical protein
MNEAATLPRIYLERILMDRCKGKKHYDTEFEAERAASKSSFFFKSEMISYKHDKHWHIANKNKNMRGKHPKYRECYVCDVIVKTSRWSKHIRVNKHLRLLEKIERKKNGEEVYSNR